MDYSHDIEKATEYAGRALDKMDQLDLPPSPDIFAVWYVYYSELIPEITRAIDVFETKKKKITADHCRELYCKYLLEKDDRERVRKAGDQIQETIKGMTGMVNEVKSATTKYSSSLQVAQGKLGTNSDKTEIEEVLKTIMQDTNDVLSRNKQLEDQLNKSSMIMQELRYDLEKIRKEAMTDGLTGLANRKSFDAEIEGIIKQANEDKVIFSLMMMDIDHFKSFNDNYGHQVGDQVLRLVALTLIEGVKGRDIACRYGGEEFAIIFPETPMQQALAVGESLRKAVAGKDIINRNSGDKLGKITLSGGIAQYQFGEKIETLIERADSALYSAKNQGRNKIVCSA